MPVSGRKAETIFHEVLSLWTLYGKRFAIVEFEGARYFDATRRREPAITSSIWVAGQGTDRDPGPRGLHRAWTGRTPWEV